MKFKLTHITKYKYVEMVNLCHNEARVSPLSHAHQVCEQHQVLVSPRPSHTYSFQDFFDNEVRYFCVETPHKILTVKAESQITVSAPPIPNLQQSTPWETVCEQLRKSHMPELLYARQFTLPSPLIAPFEELKQYALQSFQPNRPILEAAVELMQRIYQDFKFVPGFTSITTPLREVYKHKKGVCQDYAQFAIACLRALELPARYVSGYIETIPPEGKEKLQGSDASHAWLSVFDPNWGWLDLDPTNNQIPQEQHVTVAYGRDYWDVTPLKGVVFATGAHKMSVAVDMVRLTTSAPS